MTLEITHNAIDWPSLLLDYRKSRGLKQSAAAADFHVSQATISRWESGESEPTLEAKNLLFRAARRDRSPSSTTMWIDIFRRLLAPGVITSPELQVDLVTAALAEPLGVPPHALEGLPILQAFEGEVEENVARLIEAGFYSGRVASYEATLRLQINREIRRDASLYVHYVGWPHFSEDGRILRVDQGLILTREDWDEERSRMGGMIAITPA